MKFFIRTYGCQMNVHESEKIDSQLSAAGFERAKDEKGADIIIFNTCCIRNTAEQKIISHIGETKRSKQIICIVGCLAQRPGSAAALKRKFPHIAVILGTHNIGRLAEKVKEYIVNRKRLTEIEPQRTCEDFAAHVFARSNVTMNSTKVCATKQSQTDTQTSYINITYGCENYCSYCIVPYVRGKLISRDSELILHEFREIIKSHTPSPAGRHPFILKGNYTIMLLGQNVNSYVCPKTEMDFPALLERLCQELRTNNAEQIPLLERGVAAQRTGCVINFMSSHPRDFSDRLIDVIAANPQIARSVHLPLQSGCDRILALMNRRYTVAEYETKIAKLREKIPGVNISTDIICGFPGETTADFAETRAALQRIRFNAAFIFPYSRRTGTAADKMSGQLDAKTKKARATELIKLQREISRSL